MVILLSPNASFCMVKHPSPPSPTPQKKKEKKKKEEAHNSKIITFLQNKKVYHPTTQNFL